MTVTRDPATEQLLPNLASMPFDVQGSSNACGTTSLAMVMSYLGVPETKEAIDSVIRRMDIFSSPEDLVDFARDHGLQGQGYNNGLWGDIETFVVRGEPCITLIDAEYTYPDNSTISGLHYVVAVGHGIDPTNTQRYAVLHDPNYSSDMCLYEADMASMGNNVGWGFHDYYMAFATFGEDALPPGNSQGIQGVLGTLEGVTNITNGIMNVIQPSSPGSIVHGLGQFVGGVVETIVSGVGGLIQLGGQWLAGATRDIPVLGNLVAPLGDVINGIGAVIGDIGNGIGNIVSDVAKGLGAVVDDLVNGFVGLGRGLGSAFSALADGNIGGFFTGLGNALGGLVGALGSAISDAIGAVGDAIGDAIGAVGDAVSDAANAVGDAVSDFFSGW